MLLLLFASQSSWAEHLEDAPYVPAADVVRGTICALSDTHEEVALAAVEELAGWRAAEAGPQVVKLLGSDQQATVRLAAFRYFAALGPGARPFLPSVLPHLQDSEPGIRERAVNVIAASGAAADYGKDIAPLLSDKRKEVRVAAARCLEKAGAAAQPHREALLQALQKAGSIEFKVAIMDALTSIGNLPPAPAGQLIPFLADPEDEVKAAASSALFNACYDATAAGDSQRFEAVRAQTVERFRQQPPEVRGSIIHHAVKDTATAKMVMDDMSRELAESQEERLAALHVLGMAGEAALPKVPLILQQFQSPHGALRAAVLTALRGIGPKAVEPNMALVMNALRDDDAEVRSEALLTIPLCGATLKNRPYRIIDVLPKVSPEARETLLQAAAKIILTLGADAESLQGVEKAFAGPHADMRIAACFIAGQLGSKGGEPLFPKIMDLLADPDPAVQGAAAIALRSFTQDATRPGAIRTALRPLLKSSDDKVRWAALDTLAEAKPEMDAGLVKEIAGLLDDPDRSVRNAALRALGAAGSAAKPHLRAMIGMFNDDPEVPPYAAARAVLQVGSMDVIELTSLLQQAVINPSILSWVYLTAHGATGGRQDAQILIRLLGTSNEPAVRLLAKSETGQALTLLRNALQTPALHQKMKAEIEARLAEVEKLE